MKIEINEVEKSEQECVVFQIVELTSVIERAISILEEETYVILADEIDSGVTQKVKLQAVLYIEYLERAVYLYTQEETYVIKTSLKKIQSSLSAAFVQISKNMFVNVYHVDSFVVKLNGNLEATLSSKEKIIVSRRYIRNLKRALAELVS